MNRLTALAMLSCARRFPIWNQSRSRAKCSSSEGSSGTEENSLHYFPGAEHPQKDEAHEEPTIVAALAIMAAPRFQAQQNGQSAV
ncbi:hypothetical protein [Bradyrhizobium sp. USDA 4454]